ncbi:MAG: glycoside hydrolase [Candidatus Symbiothrix sp.]|jgi:glycogen debranching enzyme|nr:glycoside hydrolase [Candidatus Symbiothrix sp.]
MTHKLKKTVICLSILLLMTEMQAQTYYYDVHVPNSTVEQNSFIHQTPDVTPVPDYASARQMLPQPIWANHPDAINLYHYAWEIAFSNLRVPTKRNGFVSPFIDTAFNGCLFMWDSSFILMFGRYGSRAFDFQATLDNFYGKQHSDGFICREIRESDGSDTFERFDASSTGPNVMPWAEWEYFLNLNDTARLQQVFHPLLAYYQWFKTYRSWPDGSYFASGWGCGMDNQPRIPQGFHELWSSAHMSWIDITLQEIFAGKILIKMAEHLGKDSEVKDIREEIDYLTQYVNEKMWNNQTAFYFDRFRDGSLSDVKSIAAYWALLAQTADKNQSERFIQHLENPNEFARTVRVPALSADNPGYKADGGYWNGGVWAPSSYMVLRGLTNYEKDSLAHAIASNLLENAIEVYKQTGTLWEHYAPEMHKGMGKQKFVGWTGLIPITMLFEYVFGIRPNVPANELVWDVRLLDEHGIKNYPFGKEGVVNLLCAKRKNPKDEPRIKVSSTVDLQIKLIWEGGSKQIGISKMIN